MAVGPVSGAAPPGRTLSASPEVRERVARAVATVLSTYPTLSGARIALREISERTFFFAATKALTSLFADEYELKFNPRVFELGLSQAALEAIVAHELAHVQVYKTEGIAGLVKTGLANWGREPQSGPRIERAADLQAIARGFGPGLAEYREWVYRQLESPADVSVKKKTYFTPAEIVAIDAARLERPQLMTKWLAHPPASLAEIEADVLSAR